MKQKLPTPQDEPTSGAVNTGITSLPIVKYVKTNIKLIITGLIIVTLIIIGIILA